MDLNRRLELILPDDISDISNCDKMSNCGHEKAITSFHDCIIKCLIEAMLTHIPHKSRANSQGNIIPGWCTEMNCAREESLFWHHIWVQCDRPNNGTVYNIMKKCRATYHYMLRSLKKARNT